MVYECLALVSSAPVEGGTKYVIWVMKGCGSKELWAKLLTIGPLLGVNRPIMLCKNGDLSMLDDSDNLI